MKLKEIYLLKETLEILFEFFEENHIQATIDEISDWKSVLTELLESEYEYDFESNLSANDFTLGLKTTKSIPLNPDPDYNIAYYMFANGAEKEEEREGGEFMFDLRFEGYNSIHFQFSDQNIVLPFLLQYKDKNNISRVKFHNQPLDPEEIENEDYNVRISMSLEDFKSYLKIFTKSGKLIYIELP